MGRTEATVDAACPVERPPARKGAGGLRSLGGRLSENSRNRMAKDMVIVESIKLKGRPAGTPLRVSRTPSPSKFMLL